jgi:general secretion pathway protein E
MQLAPGSSMAEPTMRLSAGNTAERRVALPYAFARRHGVLLAPDDGTGAPLAVLLREDADPAVLIEVRRHLGQSFTVQRVTITAFDEALSDAYANDVNAEDMAGTLALGGDSNDILASGLPSADDLLDSMDDAPAIRLINGIIADAARQGVSDIHVEPYETALVIRMRIDGMLREVLRMPAGAAPVVVSRIKVMARLDIAERRVPQDGRIGLTIGGRALDVRVSTLPSRAGERVVLRLLEQHQAGIAFDALGLSGSAEQVLRQALTQPNGIILVTGPTGSGKTTTLYAALNLLNTGERNILTVEDPVEYAVDGIGQTQVNAKVGLTFAAGLRAILRQDPNVVMVGEIRDRETADIAVQASLTGHLVLSTVHTNDAVGAITRLRDMKVEPYLIASAVRGVIAQRLVRRLCAYCATRAPADAAMAALLSLPADTIVAQAKGCTACGNTGYRGRIGVYEAVRIDDAMRSMISAGADEAVLAAHAFANTPTLADAARALVADGLTTMEEALRIIRSGDADVDAPASTAAAIDAGDNGAMGDG